MPYKTKGKCLYVKKNNRWWKWKCYKTRATAKRMLAYYRKKTGH